MQWTLTFLVALAIYIYKKLNKKKLITETIEFEFTVDDLKIFDGRENVIFVGIKDKVYNVSTVKQFWPNGKYEKFAGKDITMSLVEQKIDEKLLNITHTELSELQENTIEDWHKYLTVIKRCPVAGKLRLSKNI